MIRKSSSVVLLLLLIASVASAGLFSRGEKGSGDLTTRTHDLDDCQAIRLECGLDIDITFGSEQRVALVMDDNLVEFYELTVRNGTLVIDADDDPRPSRDARLELVLRRLESVEIEGAGDITVEDLDGDRLTIDISGAGDIEASGEVERLDLVVNGAGDIDTRDLAAERATVTINGAGDVRVRADKACTVEINGVGDVDVYGDPDDFEKDVNGIGSVKKH
jgi:hypothetical protein